MNSNERTSCMSIVTSIDGCVELYEKIREHKKPIDKKTGKAVNADEVEWRQDGPESERITAVRLVENRAYSSLCVTLGADESFYEIQLPRSKQYSEHERHLIKCQPWIGELPQRWKPMTPPKRYLTIDEVFTSLSSIFAIIK